MFEFIDKTSYVVCKGVFNVLTILINVVVIDCISRLRHRRPDVWSSGFPKFLVILVCCVLQIIEAALVGGISVHNLRLKETEHEFRPSCEFWLFMQLCNSMLPSTVVLLVAAVVLLEALPRLRCVSLTLQSQTVVAVVLVVVSVLYGFVVIIPVFYLVWLKDSSQPCPERGKSPKVNIDVKVMPYVEYAVPQLVVYGSCAVLLLAFFTTRKGAGTPGVVITAPNGPPNHETESSNTSHIPAASSGIPTRPFPFYVLLAAAVTCVFEFMWFFYIVADSRDLGLTITQSIHLWAVSTLLSTLLGVFLPCCWLLDGSVRAAGCCLGCQAPMQESRSQGLRVSAASPAQAQGHWGQRQDIRYTAV